MAQQYQQPHGQQSRQHQQPQQSQQGGHQPQQYQQRSQQPTGQQSMGQQPGQQPGQRQQIRTYDEQLPNDMRTALHDFSHLKKSCEWAAEQVHGQIPGDMETSRILEDIAEIAELNEKLIARDSRHGPHLAQTFVEVAQDDLQQLQQASQQQSVLVSVVTDLQRTINSTTQMLGSIGWEGGQQPGQQSTIGRSGGQQSVGQQSQF